MLVSVDDYREGILAGLTALDPITLPLADSHGCVLAEDVVAEWPLPSFDNSSMDGYAVLATDVATATEESPVTLTVVDDVPAGARADVPVSTGNAVRIMTGAPTPSGTECIVPVELTDGGTSTVRWIAYLSVGGLCLVVLFLLWRWWEGWRHDFMLGPERSRAEDAVPPVDDDRELDALNSQLFGD